MGGGGLGGPLSPPHTLIHTADTLTPLLPPHSLLVVVAGNLGEVLIRCNNVLYIKAVVEGAGAAGGAGAGAAASSSSSAAAAAPEERMA
jgi:hypothetical protein